HLSPRPVIRHPYVDLYFFFSCYRDPRDLHSFPTRRSSDLPEDDGTYSIPEGNLFEPGQELTRPEIYAMGLRNPFRITVDPETNAVMVADYGPDARVADPNRGPEGLVEYIRMTEPGNHGWPYCHGYNRPYVDYDFATGESGDY